MIPPAPRRYSGVVAPTRHRYDEVSAGAVVVRRQGDDWEVCLIRVGDAWSLPKGNLDAAETPEAAALREVAEETGLPMSQLRVIGPLPAAEYAYRRRDGRLVFKIVHHFLLELVGSAALMPQAEEVDAVEWVPLGEAMKRVSYRDLRAALTEAARQLHPA